MRRLGLAKVLFPFLRKWFLQMGMRKCEKAKMAPCVLMAGDAARWFVGTPKDHASLQEIEVELIYHTIVYLVFSDYMMRMWYYFCKDEKGDFYQFSPIWRTVIWKLFVELSVKLRPSCHKICQNWQGLTKSNVHACDTVTAVGSTNPIDALACIQIWFHFLNINMSILTWSWTKLFST